MNEPLQGLDLNAQGRIQELLFRRRHSWVRCHDDLQRQGWSGYRPAGEFPTTPKRDAFDPDFGARLSSQVEHLHKPGEDPELGSTFHARQ